MLARKICMIGDFAVGKTSLVSRYVHNQFSSDYLTTIGVKIDTKELTLHSGDRVKLVLWDIAGTDNLATIGQNYLKGATGYILVADGTRSATLDSALELQRQAEQALGPVPFTLLLNKLDLGYLWSLNPDDIEAIQGRGWPVIHCSAKTGNSVEEAFRKLGERVAAPLGGAA